VNRNAARGRATRQHVVEVATALFAETGYRDTPIEAVMRAADVSKGALYHHFPGKDALFEAVLEHVNGRVTARVLEALAGLTDPVAELRAGVTAWIRLAGDPVVQQIVLIDAPAVLGWERWRELDEGPLAAARAGLAEAARRGTVDPRHVEVFAHALVASVTEIATMVARADDPATALVDAENALEELLSRMLGAR
jgi:AcrR family transcriptional regulator